MVALATIGARAALLELERATVNYLHEGELLSHALVHPCAKANEGKGLLVLLSPRAEAVGFVLQNRCEYPRHETTNRGRRD